MATGKTGAAALRLLSLIALVLASACDNDGGGEDAGADSGQPPVMDGGIDAGQPPGDAGRDASSPGDSGMDDAGSDGGTAKDGGGKPTDDGGMDGGAMADGGEDAGMMDDDAGSDGGAPFPVVINEYAFAHNSSFPGGANSNEYIEVFGAPNTDYSDLTILYVNGNAPGSSGRIDNVIPVGTTDAMGFWVYRSADPEADEFRNSSSTLLLVRNFTGAVMDDLDTDNDGVLDVTPWDEILDSVGARDADTGDLIYSPAVLARGFDGIESNVAAASRIPNGVDTDSASDWVRNDGAGIGLPDGPTTAMPGEGINTPGAENAVYMP